MKPHAQFLSKLCRNETTWPYSTAEPMLTDVSLALTDRCPTRKFGYEDTILYLVQISRNNILLHYHVTMTTMYINLHQNRLTKLLQIYTHNLSGPLGLKSYIYLCTDSLQSISPTIILIFRLQTLLGCRQYQWVPFSESSK